MEDDTEEFHNHAEQVEDSGGNKSEVKGRLKRIVSFVEKVNDDIQQQKDILGMEESLEINLTTASEAHSSQHHPLTNPSRSSLTTSSRGPTLISRSTSRSTINTNSTRRRKKKKKSHDSSHRRHHHFYVDRTYFVTRNGRKKRYNDLIRPPDLAVPMRNMERLRARLRRWFCCSYWFSNSRDYTSTSSHQYRILPEEEHGNSFLEGIKLLSEGSLIGWVLFHYRTSFVQSILTFLLVYFAFIIIFAFILRWSEAVTYSTADLTCIDAWEVDSSFRDKFVLVFEISWTTFSTVGYGTIGVASKKECSFMRFVLAIEAFIGILYVGFCGAIIYAKVDRIHAKAHVTFSSAICLQFGNSAEGSRFSVVPALETDQFQLDDTNDEDDCNSEEEEEDQTASNDSANDDDFRLSPYPFIEIRLVNDRANKNHGAIADSRISCMVVSVQLVDNNDEATTQEHKANKVLSSNTTVVDRTIANPATSSSALDGGNNNNDQDTISQQEKVRGCGLMQGVAQNVRRKFSRVEMTPDTHPYFEKGAWYIRHTLDQRSPLLREWVRCKIIECGGWLGSWNSHHVIRGLLNPNIFEIGIHLTGISNLTADEVFKVHVYKPEDIYIGWRFVHMNYLDTSSPSSWIQQRQKNGGNNETNDRTNHEHRYAIDLNLIHDIIPQDHGLAEQLEDRIRKER